MCGICATVSEFEASSWEEVCVMPEQPPPTSRAAWIARALVRGVRIDEAVYVAAQASMPDHTPEQVVDVLIEQSWDDQQPWDSRDIVGVLPTTVALTITRLLLDISDAWVDMPSDPVDLASAWVDEMAVAITSTPPSRSGTALSVPPGHTFAEITDALRSDPDQAWARGVRTEPTVQLPYRLIVTVAYAMDVAATVPQARSKAVKLRSTLEATLALPSAPKPREVRAS